MLSELIIFAVVLVALQLMSGLIVFKLVTSEKFLTNYTKKTMKISLKVTEDMFEQED